MAVNSARAHSKERSFVSSGKIRLFKDIDILLTLEGASHKQGRKVQEADLSILKKQAFAVRGGRVVWLGSNTKIPKEFKSAAVTSLKGKTVIPGLVECHTHLIFAGDRSHEFEMLQQGMSYQEIGQKGGGILSTVRATRKASPQELLKLGQRRVNRFLSQGVTTLEAKSGYGLNAEAEFKILKCYQKLVGPRIVSTYLGPHALSPGHKDTSSYIEEIIHTDLVALKKNRLAQRVDIFVERGYFEESQARKYLEAAKKLGFEITIHAEQLSLSGGANLAVEFDALSADHLIQIQEPEIQRLARSEVTCTLLPTSDLYLRCAYPPARRLIDAGARVALATDFNPGTSPTQDLALTGLLARLEMKMSLAEVISAYTVGASYALGLQDVVGSLEIGKWADFVVLNSEWTDLFYHAGEMPVLETWREGQKVFPLR